MSDTNQGLLNSAPPKGEPPKQTDYDDIADYLSDYHAWDERGETPKLTRRHPLLAHLADGGDWAKRRYEDALKVQNRGMGQKARPREDYDGAQSWFCEKLRNFVDRWIDSGLHPDGSETPYSRDVDLMVMASLQKFLDMHAAAEVDMHGEVTFKLRFPGPGTNPVDQALHDATVCFIRFLRSEDRFRLAKCRRCEKYFIKTKQERRFREKYLRGIHCESCRNKVTAVISRGKLLKEFEKKWPMLAVRAYQKGRAKYSDESGLKRFILLEVNSRLDPKGPRLKLNRLTMRWERIVLLAEVETEFSLRPGHAPKQLKIQKN